MIVAAKAQWTCCCNMDTYTLYKLSSSSPSSSLPWAPKTTWPGHQPTCLCHITLGPKDHMTGSPTYMSVTLPWAPKTTWPGHQPTCLCHITFGPKDHMTGSPTYRSLSHYLRPQRPHDRVTNLHVSVTLPWASKTTWPGHQPTCLCRITLGPKGHMIVSPTVTSVTVTLSWTQKATRPYFSPACLWLSHYLWVQKASWPNDQPARPWCWRGSPGRSAPWPGCPRPQRVPPSWPVGSGACATRTRGSGRVRPRACLDAPACRRCWFQTCGTGTTLNRSHTERRIADTSHFENRYLVPSKP